MELLQEILQKICVPCRTQLHIFLPLYVFYICGNSFLNYKEVMCLINSSITHTASSYPTSILKLTKRRFAPGESRVYALHWLTIHFVNVNVIMKTKIEFSIFFQQPRLKFSGATSIKIFVTSLFLSRLFSTTYHTFPSYFFFSSFFCMLLNFYVLSYVN